MKTLKKVASITGTVILSSWFTFCVAVLFVQVVQLINELAR